MNGLFVARHDEFALPHDESIRFQRPAVAISPAASLAPLPGEVPCWQEPSIPEEEFCEGACDGY
jgi:hypothetical protein